MLFLMQRGNKDFTKVVQLVRPACENADADRKV